jgi:hypothetical protein
MTKRLKAGMTSLVITQFNWVIHFFGWAIGFFHFYYGFRVKPGMTKRLKSGMTKRLKPGMTHPCHYPARLGNPFLLFSMDSGSSPE